MKKSSSISIRCTSCGAPLKIRGGGRISTITCEYCNTLLDISDEYKALTKFSNVERPNVPFKLGMVGEIEGREWIIIGWISYITSDGEEWSEFFLYSALYGYGWLIYDEGRLSFGRRVRDFDLREWEKKGKPKLLFYNKGHYLSSEELYYASINFVQGELSYIAKRGDRVYYRDYYKHGGDSLSIEESQNEVEVYINERLDSDEVYSSFGVKEELRPKAQKSIIDTKSKGLLMWSLGLVLVLLVAIITSFFVDDTLIKERVSLPYTKEFRVSSGAFLVKLEVEAPSSVILNASRIGIYKSDKKILSIDKSGVSPLSKTFRYGWHRGDDEVRVYIKLDEGLYKLIIDKAHTTNQKLMVTLKQSFMRLLYIFPIFIVIFGLLLYSYREDSR